MRESTARVAARRRRRYRRLRRAPGPHWLETALRRTWRPFLLTAVLAVLAGWGLAGTRASTLGEVRAIAASR